ncbi:hypothetical protein AB0H71_13955 [Nocardia sp. NPDC050697]|uniref:hypothetical protein n=1 Tax=Nocardia sp. NPDC050697 TaxID=3155158 RepID=UPI0034088F60
MSEHLHWVAITGTEDNPRIEFTCRGGRDAKCHQYPDCKCETWDAEHEHPFVPHDECWMQDWFDNEGIDPMAEFLYDIEWPGYRVGFSGPITTQSRVPDYIEWRFAEEVA